MSDALLITEAEAAGLSELAALDLAMARDFAERAQGAEDPETANALARSYQRMARSYRQTLALKAKLRLDTQAADRETPKGSSSRFQSPYAAGPPPVLTPQDEARIDGRADELRDAVERVIWAEHEPADPADFDPLDDDLGYHLDLLEERLAQQVRDPAFGRQPLDEHVAAMCRSLGLDPDLARRWRELPEPGFPESGGDPEVEWRGSG